MYVYTFSQVSAHYNMNTKFFFKEPLLLSNKSDKTFLANDDEKIAPLRLPDMARR